MTRRVVPFVACVGAILYLSLYPWRFSSTPNATGLLWIQVGTPRRMLLDALLNVGFYVPLGATAYLALAARRTWPALIGAIATGLGLSAAVEVLQLYLPGRFSSYVDLTTNSLGSAIGAGVALAWRLRHPAGRPARSLAQFRITPIGAMLLGLWCLSQAFPFLPTLSLTRLGEAVHQVLAPSLVPTEVALGFIALFVLSRALEDIRWLLLAFAVVPAQALIVQRALSVGEVVGAVLGLAAGRAVARRGLPLLAAVVFTSWLAADELWPFQFGPPQTFYWLPFEGLMTGSPDTYAPVVFTKLFLYATAIWLIRATGASWRWALAIPAIILAVGEYVQQYLPGRTPETTDLVMLLASGVLIMIAEATGRARPAKSSVRASRPNPMI